jgi:hypothetical protein
MDQGTTLDRRTRRDRRTAGTCRYTGPERRRLKYRRSGTTTVCLDCGEVCGEQGGWIKGSPTIETAAECLIGICTDCSSKRSPQFCTKTRLRHYSSSNP